MKKIFSLKQALMLVTVVLCGMTSSLKAQTVIKVGSVADSIAGTVDAALIKSAYNTKIPADITSSGAYVIELQGSYNPSLETYPITLGAKIGASVANNIVIKPATGVKIVLGPSNQTVIATGVTFSTNAAATQDIDLTGKITSGNISQISATSYISGIGTYSAAEFKKVTTVTGNILTMPIGTFIAASVANNKLYFGPAQTAAFKFNGATYVTIDGVSRTDINTGLIIQNPNCIYAQTIAFTGNSQYNTVKNCIIRGANQTGAWNNGFQGTVYFQAGTGNTCSYNTIDNNDICDMNDPNLPYPICALQLTAAGGTNTNHTISNNNIYNISNQYSNGTTCAVMQFGSESASTGNSVLNNKIYWTGAASFSTACNIINCGTLGLNNRFEGNTIGYTSANGTGTADLTYTVSGGTIYVLSNPKNFTCKNNTIANMKITSPNGAKAFVAFQIPTASAAAQANADNCYGNTVQNIELNSNGGNGTLYGILFAVPIYNLDIKNNVIKNLTCQSTGATYTNTIYGINTNFGAYSINITTTAGSTAATLASAALSNGVTYTIYNNANITNGTTFTYNGTTAITLSAPALTAGSAVASTITSININCIGNEVSNLTAGKSGSSANNVVTAFVSGGCSNIYEKNLIYNLNTISSGTGSLIKALRFATSKVDGITVKNNIIRLGTDVTSDAEISAIIDEGLSSNGHALNIYHNSIYIGGTSQTKPSHCFNHSTGANYGLITLKDNIFSNVRTGGTAYNQVYNLLANGEIFSSDFNLYQYGTRFATIPDVETTMSDWNIIHLDFEAGSKDQVVPLFVDATASTPDMHLPYNSPANETGTPIATVTDDFSSLLRSNYTNAPATNADMGAYVIFSATDVESAKQQSDLSVFAIENNIMFNNLSGNIAKMYSLSGQLIKSIALTSDKVAVPSAIGLYIVKVGEKSIKVLVK